MIRHAAALRRLIDEHGSVFRGLRSSKGVDLLGKIRAEHPGATQGDLAKALDTNQTTISRALANGRARQAFYPDTDYVAVPRCTAAPASVAVCPPPSPETPAEERALDSRLAEWARSGVPDDLIAAHLGREPDELEAKLIARARREGAIELRIALHRAAVGGSTTALRQLLADRGEDANAGSFEAMDGLDGLDPEALEEMARGGAS